LSTNLQNFTPKDLTEVKIFQNVLGREVTFLKRPVDVSSVVPAGSGQCLSRQRCLAFYRHQMAYIALQQVYRNRYDKTQLAATCCRLANDFTNFTDDRRTNKQIDRYRQTDGQHYRVKSPLCKRKLNNMDLPTWVIIDPVYYLTV